MSTSKMQQTSEMGSEWWNDSNNHIELQEAVDQGATGATSNPVITLGTVKQLPDVWMPVLDQLIKDNPTGTEDDLAWELNDLVGARAAKILQPVYDRTNGTQGKISLQVNPKFFRDTKAMVSHAEHLVTLAPNVALKCPLVPAGIEAMEELTAKGISINATVSFSLPQAIAAAEAVERGWKRAEAAGVDTSTLTPYITIMVGRIDDHLRGVMAQGKITIDPGYLNWASIAIFKRAYTIFKERGYRSKLLSAAIRCHFHWSEFVGGRVVISMPYKWWNQFNASTIEVTNRIEEPVSEEIVAELREKFVDFGRAYEPDGMAVSEFESFGPTVATMRQFLGGSSDLSGIVRDRMISFG
jgi:transaldolase